MNNQEFLRQDMDMRHLRLQYAKQLPAALREIADAWRVVRQAGVVDAGVLQELADRLHNVAGAAGMFGYAAVSEAAQRFEMFLRGIDDHEPRLVSVWLTEQMESFLAWLAMAQRLGGEIQAATLPDGVCRLTPAQGEGMASRRARAIVYLLAEDPACAGDICLDLQIRGYHPTHFADAAAFLAAWARRLPDVVIVDTAPGNGVETASNLAATLRDSGKCCPMIFLGERGDFSARLNAVRAGASHYLVKPADAGQLCHVLDGWVDSFRDAPYRVVLLQADNSAASLYSRWMEEAGMQVTLAANAESVLELLDAWRPELLLIDSRMPDCSGPEVAAVVRQWQGYAEMPIVFLSGDSDEEQQLLASYQGGDTFLAKPVSRARLLESVKMRVRRYRNLQWSSNQARLAVDELQELKEALDQHAIVSITDRTGVIIYANRKFCEISGYSHTELIGQNHRIVKGDMDPVIYQDLWHTIAAGRVWRGELRNKRKDGRYYWVESSIVPLSLDKNGVPERYIGIRTEVTALKEIQEALAESEERLKRSQYYANAGTWDWDCASGQVICSERVGALFGGPEGIGSISFDSFLNSVYADDRERVAASVAACLNSGVALDLEHRVLWPDGCIHWLHHKGDVVRTADGQPRHLLGVVTDVTLRKSAEEALLKQKDLLEVLRQAVLRYIGGDEPQDIAAYLLQAMLELTDSQYGLLAEVKFDGQGAPYLYTHAMGNIAGQEASRAMHNGRGGHGLEIHNRESLLGAVLTTGKAVISNDVHRDPRSSGFPKGPPPLNTFLGAPVYYGGRMVAMYGIANRRTGYDQALLEFLCPFDATVAVVMDAMRRAEDKRALQAQWVQAKEEAERANRAKTEFLSRMSHELRTPLNAVLGFAQLLDSDPDEPLSTSQKDSVEQILSAGWHLLKLINEVLDLSRIESGNVSLEMRDVEIKPMLDECLNLLAPLAAERQVHVTLDGSMAGESWVLADGMRLKQVLLNLLSNAIKYNRDGGTVNISYSESALQDRRRIAISDSGLGLSAEQQAHLFEAFNRMGAERTGVEGTGIGLVIAKRLVEMMGGEIGVDSRVGEGSTFWIELRQGATMAGANAPMQANQAAGMAPPAAEIRYKVLYVEDNVANLRVVERLLERHRAYELLAAADAEQGVELACSQKPDVILMDIDLPGMDGYAALDWLRSHTETRRIPVLALSANAMPADIQRGLDAGFDAYLAKPVKVDAVLEAIKKGLRTED